MRRVIIVGVLVALWACNGPPSVPELDPVPLAPSGDLIPPDVSAGAEALAWPDDRQAPTVSILAPADGQTVGAVVLVIATASDDVGVVAATVAVAPDTPHYVAVGPGGTIAAQLPIPPGESVVVVRVVDAAGQWGEASVTVSRPVGPDAGPPEIAITAPADGLSLRGPSVVIEGTATDDQRVETVQVDAGGAVVTAETASQWASWRAVVTLPPGAGTVTATARDMAGNQATATIQVTTTAPADTKPPTISIEALVATEPWLLVSGVATDDVALDRVLVRAGAGPFLAAELAADGAWSRLVALAPGDNIIKAIAVDAAGNDASASTTVTLGDTGWSAPQTWTLRWTAPAFTQIELPLDEEFLCDSLPPAAARQIVLLNLDPTVMLAAALDQLVGACGEGWSEPGFVPACPPQWGAPERNMWRLLTMTTRTADVEGTSIANLAEIANVLAGYGLIDDFPNMLAITLGVSPDDPLVPVDAVASAIRAGLIATHPCGGADGSIAVTLEDALCDMATLGLRFGEAPPPTDTPCGGAVPFCKAWAGESLGAVGEGPACSNGSAPLCAVGPCNPGFVAAGQTTTSQVLGDDFLLLVRATSNLHWHEGVTLGMGKSFVGFVADGKQDVLDMDFSSAATFEIQGLVDDPLVDLPFVMKESPLWLAAGTSPPATPPGDGPLWTLGHPWEIEPIVGAAALERFGSLRVGCDGCEASCVVGKGACDTWPGGCLAPLDGTCAMLWEIQEIQGQENDLAEIVIGRAGVAKDGVPKHFPLITPDPPGWMRIWTIGDLGEPPPPVAVWDMLAEVAQRRLHDPFDGDEVPLAEGEADVSFSLLGLPVGLSAEGLVEAIRPTMQAQRSKLVSLMLGDWWQNAGDPDVFLARSASGALLLAQTVAGDPTCGAQGAAKLLDSPGFFADPALQWPAPGQTKQAVLGALRPVLPVAAGPMTPVYVQGRDGTTWELRVEGIDDERARVTARAKQGAP